MSEDELRNQSFISGRTEEQTDENSGKKLEKPRDLYSTASLCHVPKWPVECQVIPEKIHHIETTAGKMEPFYNPSYAENQPKPVGEALGTVIYNYLPKLSVDYFCRACAGGADDLHSFDTDVNTLKFESRFESGNLAKVIKVTNVYYELYLRPDMYTDRHSQWFYFRIQNTRDNLMYRFSIVNLTKPDALYRYGLKPLMYSEKEAQLKNVGWFRTGHSISYYKNDIMLDDNNSFYTLTFNIKFRHNNDTVYIAQCYPYTYTKLQQYLAQIEDDENKSKLCQQRLLCRSLAGNNVYVLTITSPDTYLDESSKKPVIAISARVHPGEPQSSYMMKGIIDFLTSNYGQAKDLRDRFIFKLIPMLNPDGVVVGNSRCCLLGQDLNRQYRTVLREAFPQIYHTKVMLRRLMDENGIFLYCDLHGHSRRNNAFMYGCENKRTPEQKLREQVFPLMMHKNASDKFSFQSCKFKIQRSKEGTGRVFAWTLGVSLSYTLEVSLGGSTMLSRQHFHFNTYDYEGIGRHFCETLLDFSDSSPSKEKLRDRILQKLLQGGSKAEEPLNISITDYSSLSHSESEESCDDAEVSAESKPGKPPSSFVRRNSVRSSGSGSHRLGREPTLKGKAERPPVVTKGRTDEPRTGQRSAVVDADVARGRKKVDKGKGAEEKEGEPKSGKSLKHVNFDTVEEGTGAHPHCPSTKCSNILFDDPFKLPGAEAPVPPPTVARDGDSAEALGRDKCDKTRQLPQASSAVTQVTQNLALLNLASKTRTPDPAVDPTAVFSEKLLKAKLKTPLPSQLQSTTKSEVKSCMLQKHSHSIRRKSFSVSLNHSLDPQGSKKTNSSLDSRSHLSYSDLRGKSRTKFQQRRVSWSEMTLHSLTWSKAAGEKFPQHSIDDSTEALLKKGNRSHVLHQLKRGLKKSHSVGDKLEGAMLENSSRKDTTIGHIKSTALRKKKLKRHKTKKN